MQRPLARFRSWLHATLRRSRTEQEMDAELRFHIETFAEDLTRHGVPREEAQRRARAEFGSLDLTREQCRDARGPGLLLSLLRDLSYGLRVLRKSPGFAAMAVLTLALGIGASTAVFSVVNAVLLRALPYQDPDGLVFLWEPSPHFSGIPLEAFSPDNADFYDWQQQSHSFQNLALFTTDRLNLSGDATAVNVGASRVTGDFFRIFGIPPELGRTIEPADDQPGMQKVAVISHALWQSRFGSDRAVLGKDLLLNARPYRIIGVMPRGFAFPHGAESLTANGWTTDVWMAWAMTPKARASRDDNSGNAIGRLRPGVSASQAQAEMQAIVARLDPLHEPIFQGAHAVVRPLAVYLTGSSRRTLLIFLGAVFLVLLIACSNVASLVLARANGRTLEIALRAALGASRLRLIRQLLAESLCLATAGGVLGTAVASLAIRVLVRFHPASIARLEETSMDGRVLLFTIGVSLATAILSGLLPAWSASRCSLVEVLKSSGSRSVKGGRLRHGLMVAEVALTVVLLIGSGLLIRALLRLQSVDKGFAAASRVTMTVRLDSRYNQQGRQFAFFHNLIERAGALPGVETAAAADFLPLAGGESLGMLQVEGHPFDEKTLFEGRSVTPRYFAAMGIPVIAGRVFTDDDVAGRPPVRIVSRSFARTYFPGQSAVGKRFRSGPNDPNWQTIVGVVSDVRQRELDAMPPMQVYSPLWEATNPSACIVVRTSLPADRVASDMRALLKGIDPAIALADVRSMTQIVAEASADRRFQTLLLTAFGGMALFLSLVGLYALMAYSVQQRTAEIGIRMALGASRSSVLRLVLRQGSTLAFGGVALGFACAWGVTRLLTSLLFEIKPTDPTTFFVVAILICLVALAACYFPARRATRVDPMVALRYE